MNDTFKKTKCLECKKDFWRITNTHLWKAHQMTMDEYKNKYPTALFEDKNISLYRQESRRGKTYEEIFGKKEGMIQKDIRKISATNQMKNPEQIIIRKQKSGYKHTEEQKKQSREKHTIHGGNNYRERALLFYDNECMRCGNTNNLVIHHKDMRNDKSKYGNHALENLLVLCKSCHSKLHNENHVGKFTGINLVEKGAIYILRGLEEEFGLNLKDKNFLDTPKRMARAYYEMFNGINADKEIKEILSTKFPTEYDGMVIESPIRCYSMCPHHLLPVIYDISIGYIPSNGGLGLSKLPRLVELLAKAPKLQEDYTKEIVYTINKAIKPKGVMVIVKGEHMCMQMRGVKKPGCSTITSSVSGSFEKDYAAKEEFMRLIK